MANHFCVRSASGRIVSLLNPMDEPGWHSGSASSSSPTPKPPTEGTVIRITKNFRCADCAKVFTTAGHLTRHATVHSGEKNFTCPFPDCSKKCSRHDNLLQHFKIHLSPPDRDKGPEYIADLFSQMAAIYTPDQVAKLAACQARTARAKQYSGDDWPDTDGSIERDERGAELRPRWSPLSSYTALSPMSPLTSVGSSASTSSTPSLPSPLSERFQEAAVRAIPPPRSPIGRSLSRSPSARPIGAYHTRTRVSNMRSII